MNRNDEQTGICQVCDACGKPLSSHQFGISRQFERTILSAGDALDEVDVIDSCGIQAYCSTTCLNGSRRQVLAQDNLRTTYPDIGPIESCSRCGRPVVMKRFHMAWVEDELVIEDWRATLIHAEVLAVACEQCAPLLRLTPYDG